MKPILTLAAMLWVTVLHAADAPTTFKVSEFTFQRPAKWEWVETASPMRKAQLKVFFSWFVSISDERSVENA